MSPVAGYARLAVFVRLSFPRVDACCSMEPCASSFLLCGPCEQQPDPALTVEAGGGLDGPKVQQRALVTRGSPHMLSQAHGWRVRHLLLIAGVRSLQCRPVPDSKLQRSAWSCSLRKYHIRNDELTDWTDRLYDFVGVFSISTSSLLVTTRRDAQTPPPSSMTRTMWKWPLPSRQSTGTLD
jgi:hypothetical protein